MEPAVEVWCFGENLSGATSLQLLFHSSQVLFPTSMAVPCLCKIKGQLGIGNDEPVGTIKQAPELSAKRFLQVACGGQHTAGINGITHSPPPTPALSSLLAVVASLRWE